MTDFEMTRLCGRAMGLPEIDEDGEYFDSGGSHRSYWPLVDDKQAMALMKRFDVSCVVTWDGNWQASVNDGPVTRNDDLNCAIVECVSNLVAKQKLQGEVK